MPGIGGVMSEQTDRISKFLKDHGYDLGDISFRTASEVDIAMCSIMQETIEKMERAITAQKSP